MSESMDEKASSKFEGGQQNNQQEDKYFQQQKEMSQISQNSAEVERRSLRRQSKLEQKKIISFVNAEWHNFDIGNKQYLNKDESFKFINKIVGPLIERDFIPQRMGAQIDQRIKNPKDRQTENYFFNHEKETIFQLMDKDGNGKLTKHELTQFVLLVNESKELFKKKSEYISKVLDNKSYIDEQYQDVILRLIQFDESDPQLIHDRLNEEIVSFSMGVIEDRKILFDIISPYVKQQKKTITPKPTQSTPKPSVQKKSIQTQTDQEKREEKRSTVQTYSTEVQTVPLMQKNLEQISIKKYSIETQTDSQKIYKKEIEVQTVPQKVEMNQAKKFKDKLNELELQILDLQIKVEPQLRVQNRLNKDGGNQRSTSPSCFQIMIQKLSPRNEKVEPVESSQPVEPLIKSQNVQIGNGNLRYLGKLKKDVDMISKSVQLTVQSELESDLELAEQKSVLNGLQQQNIDLTEQIDVLEKTLGENQLEIMKNKEDLQSYLLKKKIKARVLQTKLSKVERSYTEKKLEKKKFYQSINGDLRTVITKEFSDEKAPILSPQPVLRFDLRNLESDYDQEHDESQRKLLKPQPINQSKLQLRLSPLTMLQSVMNIEIVDQVQAKLKQQSLSSPQLVRLQQSNQVIDIFVENQEVNKYFKDIDESVQNVIINKQEIDQKGQVQDESADEYSWPEYTEDQVEVSQNEQRNDDQNEELTNEGQENDHDVQNNKSIKLQSLKKQVKVVNLWIKSEYPRLPRNTQQLYPLDRSQFNPISFDPSIFDIQIDARQNMTLNTLQNVHETNDNYNQQSENDEVTEVDQKFYETRKSESQYKVFKYKTTNVIPRQPRDSLVFGSNIIDIQIEPDTKYATDNNINRQSQSDLQTKQNFFNWNMGYENQNRKKTIDLYSSKQSEQVLDQQRSNSQIGHILPQIKSIEQNYQKYQKSRSPLVRHAAMSKFGKNVIAQGRFSITSPLFKRKADNRLPNIKTEFASSFTSPFFGETNIDFPKAQIDRIVQAKKPKIHYTFSKPSMKSAETQVSENEFPNYLVGSLTQERLPVYEQLDFKNLNQKVLLDIQHQINIQTKRKKLYKDVLKMIAEDIVRLKAYELETKEQLFVRSGLRQSDAKFPLNYREMIYNGTQNINKLNKYKVEDMGKMQISNGSKPIRFIGQRHLLMQININTGLQQGKTLSLIKIPCRDGQSFVTIPKSDLDIKSKRACGNDQILLDYSGQKWAIFYNLNTFQQIVKLQMKVDFMIYIGHGTLDIFILCLDKDKGEFIVFDGRISNLGEKYKENNDQIQQINTDIQQSLSQMIVHRIEYIKGGNDSSNPSRSSTRNFCIVEHDENEQTIFELEFIDNVRRNNLHFRRIVHFDHNMKVVSTLINQNKLLVSHTSMSSDQILIFNMDMRVFWKCNGMVLKHLRESESKYLFIIPNSGLEGTITQHYNAIELNHSGLQEKLFIAQQRQDETTTFRVKRMDMQQPMNDKAGCRQIYVLSLSEEQTHNFDANKQFIEIKKLSWEAIHAKKKKIMIIEDDDQYDDKLANEDEYSCTFD